jgi:hypothetical protein
MKRGIIVVIMFVFLTICFTLQVVSQPKPVDPVNWRELVPFLTDIEGWKAQGDATGSTVNTGNFKMSQVEREYTRNGIELEIQIIDGGYAPMVYAGFKAMSHFEIDTSDEYVKKTKIKGFIAIENYHFKRKKATIMILVVDRFMIQLEAREMKDTSELKAIAQLLDLKALDSLAK